MKLHEVLELVKKDEWFRPVSWAESGQAYCIDNNRTALVPTDSGAIQHMTSSILNLKGDWEIVLPGTVLKETSALPKN